MIHSARHGVLAASLFGCLLASPLLPGSATAGELVYQPVNPSFGGDPLNGSFLLNSAQIQNQHKDDGSGRSGFDRSEPDPLAEFTESLQRRLLSTLSSQIVDAIYGEDQQDSGTFRVGDTVVEFETIGDQVEVVISDLATGGETQISLPQPQF